MLRLHNASENFLVLRLLSSLQQMLQFQSAPEASIRPGRHGVDGTPLPSLLESSDLMSEVKGLQSGETSSSKDVGVLGE